MLQTTTTIKNTFHPNMVKKLNITRRVNNKNIVLISAHIYSVSVYKMNHTFSVKYVLQNGECLQNIVIFDESYM